MKNSKATRYKTTNWSEYNQALRNRGSFTLWLDPSMQWYANPTHQKGRQETYSDTAIQFALTLRHLFSLALRQTQGFIQSIFQLAKIDWHIPDFSTLSRRADTLQPIIHKSAKNKGEALHLLLDSTGIKLTGDGEWVRKKYGVQQSRQWLKLHLAIDADNGEIQAVEVTTCQYGDPEMLKPLLDQVDEPIASVTADGAYDTVTCYDTILKRQAKPIIPPRSNAVLWQENAIGIARNHAVQGCRNLGWSQWKREVGYHQRSRVESKMFAFKRLGQGVSSRCFNRQVVDLYIRVNIMNRFTQLGIAKTVAVA